VAGELGSGRGQIRQHRSKSVTEEVLDQLNPGNKKDPVGPGSRLQGVDLGTIERMPRIRNKKIAHPMSSVVGTRGSNTSLPVRSTWDLQDACHAEALHGLLVWTQPGC
jgi:hypothetical protein